MTGKADSSSLWWWNSQQSLEQNCSKITRLTKKIKCSNTHTHEKSCSVPTSGVNVRRQQQRERKKTHKKNQTKQISASLRAAADRTTDGNIICFLSICNFYLCVNFNFLPVHESVSAAVHLPPLAARRSAFCFPGLGDGEQPASLRAPVCKSHLTETQSRSAFCCFSTWKKTNTEMTKPTENQTASLIMFS